MEADSNYQYLIINPKINKQNKHLKNENPDNYIPVNSLFVLSK